MRRAWLIVILASCNGNGIGLDAIREAPAATLANIASADVANNLIANGDFEDYTDANVPDGWSVDEIYGYRGMYAPTDGWTGLGVAMNRNAQGRHLLAQTVAVEPGRRYTAEVLYQVTATDSSNGGLYVFDPADRTVVASDTINRPSNGWRIATVSFDSGARTQVTVEIGYTSGMNGTAVYDGVRLFPADPDSGYRYQSDYRDVIAIAAQPADVLVPQLSDYVTSLLAQPFAVRQAHHLTYGAELPYYLDSFLASPNGDSGRAAWCQHTALALGELLAMYGVPTRQIHTAPLQHEFLEYFNGTSWVAFDPYYGVRYVLADKRLGVDAIAHTGLDQVSIEVPTHEHVFLLELGYLRQIWNTGGSFRLGLSM